MIKKHFLLLSLIAALTACADVKGYRNTSVPIGSVALFDAEKYTGVWYEIASYPTPFQSGCTNTTATYSKRDDGEIDVVNRCDTEKGPRSIAGTAKVVGPGRLEVRLSGVPVSADYWVLWVDQDYRTAVVGNPAGRSGWILNREPTISQDRLVSARRVLAFNGYDLSQLRMTSQDAP